MGQRLRYHLELAKEEKGDEMGWQKRQAGLLTDRICCPLALEVGDPEVQQTLIHTLWPFTYQVCWRFPPGPPKGWLQCWEACTGGSSVPRGLYWGVQQAALGSGPRAQRKRA